MCNKVHDDITQILKSGFTKKKNENSLKTGYCLQKKVKKTF